MKEIKTIDRRVVLKNLGYEAERIDDDFMRKLDICEEKILPYIHPRYISCCYDIEIENERIIFTKPDLQLPGEKIVKDLYYCKKAVLFCATISDEAEPEILAAEKTDIEKAVMLDSMAHAALEECCDNIEKEIAAKYPEYQITYRFSPAYEDLPKETNVDFTAVLNSESLAGISYNPDTEQFSPKYSIAAILGLMNK